MAKAGLMGGGRWEGDRQDGELKKSAWFSVQAVCRGQRARIERSRSSGEPSGQGGGISAPLHAKNLSRIPSLSAPKRQRREREPCVKSQKCPANSIAIRDK